MRRLIVELSIIALVWALALAVLVGACTARGSDPSQSAYPLAGPPVATLLVSEAGSSTPALPGGSCYRVGCVGARVYWRVGTLPLTATTSDNPMSGTANCLPACVAQICLRSTYNGIAFVTAPTTQATCAVAALAAAP